MYIPRRDLTRSYRSSTFNYFVLQYWRLSPGLIEGTYFNIIKAIQDKSAATFILHLCSERISSKIRNETSVTTLPVLLNTVLEILAGAISQEKEMKGIQT
jgi:hypothetical protein